MANLKQCTYQAPDYFEVGVIKGSEMFKGMDLIPLKGYADVYIKGDCDFEIFNLNIEIDYLLFMECLVEWLAKKTAKDQNSITFDGQSRFVAAINELLIDFVYKDIEDNLGDLLCGATCETVECS